MKIEVIGSALIAIGALVMLYAQLAMPVSFPGADVVNLQLISERQNTLIIGGMIFLAGIVLFSVSKLKQAKVTSENESEPIQVVAMQAIGNKRRNYILGGIGIAAGAVVAIVVVLNMGEATTLTMPLDNIVANLADPGGDKIVQVGVTLVASDIKSAIALKLAKETIRNNILMVLSNKTSGQLTTLEGKELLSKEIKAMNENIGSVLFSSFVVM
jgi:flagellar basal body-associated protein FliL